MSSTAIQTNDLREFTGDLDAAQVYFDQVMCKRSLYEFVKRAWQVLEPSTNFIEGRMLRVLCKQLEDVTYGNVTRLLINVPPGTMKSLLVSVLWPAWEWGPCEMPHLRYVGVAHELGLAMRDATKMRRLVKSEWFQARWPHVEIAPDQDAKQRFENSVSGFRVAKSSTGITGERGDRVIFDDPHSVAGANSDQQRPEVVQNFREALNTRINDAEKSAIVVIMQRLHEKDVSGTILEHLHGWTHLCLPMYYDPDVATDHDWRTQRGELLFPERFNKKAVEELENTLGPYAFSGQMQQRPTPREGGLFETSEIEIVDSVPPGLVRVCRAWDFAASVVKTGTDPDWTVGVKMGMLRDKRVIILAMTRFRKSPADVERELKGTSQQDGRNVRIRIPQDPGQAGKAQASQFTRLLHGYKVVALRPTGSKVVRAEPFAAQVGAGNVLMLRGAWNQQLIDELGIFPGGAHDDAVDAAADAYDELVNGKWINQRINVRASTV